MKYSNNQKEFIDLVMSGQNIFLSGKAGTGKSFITKEAIKMLNDSNKSVIVVAPTGIASNNIGGATIHSTFSLTPFGVITYDTCSFMKSNKREVLKKAETIFIDEVSMLRPDMLDGINWTLIKNGLKPLSEYQVVFIGDLKQLGIVADDNMLSMLLKTYDGFEFTNAKCYKELNVKTIELEEILRQSDEKFINALNIIRDGKKAEYFRQFVTTTPKGIILAPHNSTVEQYNIDGLNKIVGQTYYFTATIEGNLKAADFNLDNEIKVKDGCKIMYLSNSKNNNLFNGTLGIFRAEEGKFFIEVGKEKFALEEKKFTKKEYVLSEETNKLELKEIGTITQIPIKLAYALSIHKSQGLTFDECTIDLRKPCFAKGQMYVALSRVKTPDGLAIITV